MRRIMIDRMTHGDKLLATKPNGDQKTMRLPEPDDDNDGPTGLHAIAEFPRSQQALQIEVVTSGDFVDYNRDDGAKFVVKPDYLRDENGDSIIDDGPNEMGAERVEIPIYTQMLTAEDQTLEWNSPRACKLERWRDVSSVFGRVGILVCTAYNGSDTGHLHAWFLDEYNDQAYQSYVWENSSGLRISSFDTTVTPYADVVELSDGSVLMVLTTSNGFYIYKLFAGTSWVLVDEVSISKSYSRPVAIERVGSRVVMVYSTQDGTDSYIYCKYSDDGGLTWSSLVTVKSIIGTSTEIYLDLVRGLDGRLWLCWNRADTGIVYVDGTDSGESWDGEVNTTIANAQRVAMYQDYFAKWYILVADDSGSQAPVLHYLDEDATIDTPNTAQWTNVGYVGSSLGDTDGMETWDVGMCGFMWDGFLDYFLTFRDTHSTTYHSVAVLRGSMWTGIQLNPTTKTKWDNVWIPFAFPSTSDAHPNVNFSTRTQNGAGSAAFGSDGEFKNHLEITTTNTTDDHYYRYDGIASNSYTNGVIVRFEAKIVSGYMKVRIVTDDDAANMIDFTVTIGSSGQNALEDNNAGTNPDNDSDDNWANTEWNEYTIITKGTKVRVYRAPSGDYREFNHQELILTHDALTAGATAGNHYVYWGCGDGLAHGASVLNAASEAHWRSVMIGDSLDTIDWDFESDVVGRKCHLNAVGIMQGFGVEWDGSFAVDGDIWEVDTGALYQAENVFVVSPSVRWQEPVVSGASDDAVFDFDQDLDSQDNQRNFNFNALAVFGRNWLDCKLEGADADGASWTTIFDSQDAAGPELWIRRHAVASVDRNKIRLAMGDYENMIDDEFASNDDRKWYVYYINGTLADHIYRIDGNDRTRLFLEVDVETAGASGGSTESVYIFSDRFFLDWEYAGSYEYERLRFTIHGVQTSPSECQLRMGTLLMGRTYELNDDEWDTQIGYQPNVSVREGRSGRKEVRRLGQWRRTIDMRWTGQVDAGMGICGPVAMLGRTEMGVHPVVWIDDDAALDAGGNKQAHHEPILARLITPFTAQRESYYPSQEYHGGAQVTFNRNIMQISGVTLEEVL